MTSVQNKYSTDSSETKFVHDGADVELEDYDDNHVCIR